MKPIQGYILYRNCGRGGGRGGGWSLELWKKEKREEKALEIHLFGVIWIQKILKSCKKQKIISKESIHN